MNMQDSLRIVVASVLVVFGTACAAAAASGPSTLAGTWTNSLGAVWTFTAEGTFYLKRAEPKQDIWGSYMVAGDTVTIQETRRVPPGVVPGYTGFSQDIPEECQGLGVYKFSRPNHNTLTFTLVSDTCKLRKKNVLLGWHRK
jgi:hypothetical protein